MIHKIKNLSRLKGNYLFIVLGFYFKKIVKLKSSQKENKIANFYYALVKNRYKIVSHNKKYGTIKSDFNDMQLSLRNFPSSDIDVFYQIFLNKEYQEVFTIAKKYFGKQKMGNILDLGGNIGLTSLFLLSEYADSKIIILEPDTDNFETLKLNLLTNNNFQDNVFPCNGGIWSNDTKLKISSDFRDGLDWSYRVEESGTNEGIDAYSIQSLCEKYNFKHIDVLKIDVEGTEKILFDANKTNLDFLNFTKIIAIEIREEICQKSVIYDVLEKYGFVFYEDRELSFAYNSNLID